MGSAGLGCLLYWSRICLSDLGPLALDRSTRGQQGALRCSLDPPTLLSQGLGLFCLFLREPLKTWLRRRFYVHFLIFYTYSNPNAHWQ